MSLDNHHANVATTATTPSVTQTSRKTPPSFLSRKNLLEPQVFPVQSSFLLLRLPPLCCSVDPYYVMVAGFPGGMGHATKNV